MPLVVQDFIGSIVKLHHYPTSPAGSGAICETVNHQGHQGTRRKYLKKRPSSFFMPLVVQDFIGSIVKLHRYPTAPSAALDLGQNRAGSGARGRRKRFLRVKVAQTQPLALSLSPPTIHRNMRTK
jgi:hypothetical protein